MYLFNFMLYNIQNYNFHQKILIRQNQLLKKKE